MKPHYLLILSLLFFTHNSLADDIYATTDDGLRVLLKDDSSWVFIESMPESTITEEDSTTVDLEVIGKWDMGHSCRIGLTLTNRKADFIRNLGLEFTAYINKDVSFDTIIIGFHGIKPTQYQYRDAIFEGINCQNIDHIQVHGGSRCSVGEELVKFSSAEGACLASVNILDNDLITIHK